jgi:hypothetical protein
MPLRDHFRSPLDDIRSWGGLHGGWPMMIVQQLLDVLPEEYFAEPTVHLGTICEVDIGTFRDASTSGYEFDAGNGGVAVATDAPPRPTLTFEPRLSGEDVYEVRIYDSRRKRELVAAIEIVSPSNKDRPEHRGAFVTKVADLLKHGICVSIVDVVTTHGFNLYAELLDLLEGADPDLDHDPPPIYAVTMRVRRDGRRKLLDNWYHPLQLDQPLPTLPVWLREHHAIALDLEACRTLRIR